VIDVYGTKGGFVTFRDSSSNLSDNGFSAIPKWSGCIRLQSLMLAIGRSSFVFATLLPAVSDAQVSAPGFVNNLMLVSPISGDEAKEMAFNDISMAPGASSPRHTHPGDCYGAVIDGTVELRIEGHEPSLFSARQVWHVPRGLIHEFVNVGDTPVRLVNTLVVDKGKVRTQIVPAPQK
jgi:quercetin dioxygenase-like cupin family protein